ncbi:MAG: thiamine phosphate synthase [Elusimicrobia bacterium]|nr:thiamine phosphate synthase [Candidatus Liberimonas magnetica]
MKGYYFITDASLSLKGNLNDVEMAVAAGTRIVQYRNKEGSTKELLEEATLLIKKCTNKLFIINDRIDIALAIDADGVHLGQDDMPYKIARKLLGKDKIIGITVHGMEEAMESYRAGANYLAVSPVYKTKTKHDAGKPLGVELIKKIKKEMPVPVVAIGGIDLANAAEVVSAGADAICAISSVITKPNVKEEIEKFQKFFGIVKSSMTNAAKKH